jgi:AbrB family looped-hinge helix DNA binding protein
MQVTVKGQVTIPQHIRIKLGIRPRGQVEFVEENGRVYLRKADDNATSRPSPFRRLRGRSKVQMTTDEILALTRGDD